MWGSLESFRGNVARGWVRLRKADYDANFPLCVEMRVKGDVLVEGEASTPRADLASQDHIGLGFALNLKDSEQRNFLPSEVDLVCVHGSTVFPIKMVPTVQAALQLRRLDERALRGVLSELDNATLSTLSDVLRTSVGMHDQPVARSGTACVVSYVHDASGWFPYFYTHYASIVGPERIYIITPNPQAFADYKLGGVVSASDLQFDDIAKSYFVSNFANALRAYYKWTIVCDADEIIVPHPKCSRTFLELLENSESDILISRGLDVIQVAGEGEFDFEKAVIGQRQYAVPNMALCKPHFSRVPVRYSGGYHYCNKSVDFAPLSTSFVTLHLKWACRRVRAEVGQIVANTNYADERIAAYAASSVDSERSHPMSQLVNQGRVHPLVGEAMDDFEAKYRASVTYHPGRDLWVGALENAGFVVSLSSN